MSESERYARRGCDSRRWQAARDDSPAVDDGGGRDRRDRRGRPCGRCFARYALADGCCRAVEEVGCVASVVEPSAKVGAKN